MVSELFSNFHSRYVKADSPFTDTVHPASPHIYSRTPHHLTTNSLTMPVTPALAFAMGQGGTYIHFSQVLVLRCSSKPDCLGHSDPDRIQQHPTDLLPPPIQVTSCPASPSPVNKPCRSSPRKSTRRARTRSTPKPKSRYVDLDWLEI